MRRLAHIGVAGALAFSGGACAESRHEAVSHELADKTAGVSVVTRQPGTIYRHPNAINDPKENAGALKVGQAIVAVCYYESETLGIDSLGLADRGYAFIYTDVTHPKAVFNVPQSVLRDALPLCEGK